MEKIGGVERFVVDPDLIVQMARGAAPGVAYHPQLMTKLDLLTERGLDRTEMGVARDDAHAVVDLDHVAVGA